MRVRFTLIVWLACLAVIIPASAHAQGHMLHGVGPINSSMGGAGTGLPEDSLAALMYNPALIGTEPGNQITFASEFFENWIQIDVNAFGRSGHSEGTPSLGIIPAFGWMAHDPSKKYAIGFGLIGIAGFRTDYAENPDSIIFAKPAKGGFGRIFTDYGVLKIPVGFSYQATPKLAIGLSVDLYRANLDISPLPFQVFDRSGAATPVAPAGTTFYPEGGNQIGRFAIGAQFGVYYKHSDMMSLGASISTPQNFSPFQWNSFYADPTSPKFGDARVLSYDLDGPLMANFGVGLKPNPKTQIALDGTFIKYTGVEGFGSPGGIVDGVVYPFGWRNIWAFKGGVRYQATPTMNVRLGYSYSQTPIKPENILTATGAPATFQNHVTAGAGIKVFPFLTLEASFYYVPREHVVGPYLVDQLSVPRPTTPGTMDTSNQLTSGLVGLNFRF